MNKLRTEDKFAEQIGHYATSDTKRNTAPVMIWNRLAQELDDAQKALDILKTKHSLDLDDVLKELDLVNSNRSQI